MTVVKSTYNFVPAPKEDEVFYPDWADQVNQDIPFSDGESGEIEFKITAETPIFIRNGHSEQDQKVFEKYKNWNLSGASQEEKEAYERFISFSNLNGKYFIPATSLKGMVRNTLEIISNSKLSQYNNHRHSIRQIMRTEGTIINEGYELSDDDVKRKIKCGYLVQEGNNYYIYSCGTPLKIRYTDIDRKFGSDFEAQFGAQDQAGLSSNFDNRTAKYKYDLLGNADLEAEFEIHPLDETDKQSSWVSKFQPLQYARFTTQDIQQKSFQGRIVLVGQSMNYVNKNGKVNKQARKGEYVFRGRKAEIITNKSVRIEVSKEKIENFKFVNRDGEGENIELKDWGYWKSKIKEGIPVFYREQNLKGANEVIDFGLPYMYKQPAKYNIKDLLPKYKSKNDLAETIFGFTGKKESLKGRVLFSHAKCTTESPSELDEITVTLSSPKSSFTPNYLVQEKGKNGKTFKFNTYNTGGSLRGFKKYPVKNSTIDHKGDSEKMQTIFKPLGRDTTFKAKVRFHNLRPIEIGALISAISLNLTEGTYHNLGYAKPLGYGMVKISDINIQNTKKDFERYVQLFEVEMRARFGENWAKRIEELLTISSLQDQEVESNLTYNNLDEYQDIKNKGLYLQSYSEIAKRFKLDNSLSQEVTQRYQEINREEIEKNNRIKQLKEEVESLKEKMLYEEAINKIKELHQLNEVEDLDNKIKDLKNLQANKTENDYIDEILEKQNLDELKSFVSENQYHKRSDEIRRIINSLTISDYPERYTKIDLRLLLKEVPNDIKRGKIDLSKLKNQLAKDFERALKDAFEKENFKKKWLDFQNANTWRKINQIIGEDLTKKIFDNLINE